MIIDLRTYATHTPRALVTNDPSMAVAVDVLIEFATLGSKLALDFVDIGCSRVLHV
jgi:hypothetical protein